MKLNTLLTAAFASVIVFSASSFASPEASTACTTDAGTKPVAIKVVNPTDLPLDFKKAFVQLELTIDERGVPHDVRAVSRLDKRVAARLLPAVRQWRFTPSYVDGRPVSTRVVLPLDVVAGA